MMRRMFSVGLVAALALGVAGTAGAATSIDLVFSGSGNSVTTISPFSTVTMAVFMTTNDGLEAFSTSIAWDNGGAVAVLAGTSEWTGFVGGFGTTFAPLSTGFPAGNFVDLGNQVVWGFDGAQLGSAVPSATFRLGTITWLASGAGTTLLTAFAEDGFDGFLVAPGTVVTGTVTFGGATINVIPEPATASLLGLGLIGLILAGRRKRA